MATFTTIPDTDLDADSPITENLMLALRDNPLAIAQGDVSAPKIALSSLAEKIPTSYFTNYTSGSWVEAYNHNTYGLTEFPAAPTLFTAGRLKMSRSGTVTSVFTLQGSNGAYIVYGRVYKNGVAVGTTRSVAGTTATFTENISVSAGDELQVYIWQTGGASNSGKLSLFNIKVSNPTGSASL
jgi:hypothetical protein